MNTGKVTSLNMHKTLPGEFPVEFATIKIKDCTKYDTFQIFIATNHSFPFLCGTHDRVVKTLDLRSRNLGFDFGSVDHV